MGGENASYTASFNSNNQRAGASYDLAGIITSDGGQSFNYDATGQQATASLYSTQMSYDGDRLREKKVENGVATYYIRSSVLGGAVVCDVTSTGSWQRGYIYLGGQLLAYQENNRVLWAAEEPVTKGKRLTDSTGAVVSVTELDPWGGETARSQSSGLLSHKYTTYERDANQSDEAMHRRYNRWWSRFEQPDPADFSYDLSNPQSFNRYSYTQNDPVNYVDPSGLMANIAGNCFTYYGDNLDGFGTVGYGGNFALICYGNEWGGYQPPDRPEPGDPGDPPSVPAQSDDNPCASKYAKEVERDLRVIAQTVGGSLGEGWKINGVTNSYKTVVQKLTAAGFESFPGINPQHWGSTDFQGQVNGRWYHVNVYRPQMLKNFPKGNPVDPNKPPPSIQAHCEPNEPFSFSHAWDWVKSWF